MALANKRYQSKASPGPLLPPWLLSILTSRCGEACRCYEDFAGYCSVNDAAWH